VETAARLHFGLLDLSGASGRRFGGIGAAAPCIGTRISVEPFASIEARGEDARRAAEFARRFMDHHGIRGGARITIERAVPSHAGLGSGTQLGLSVARALAELYDLPSAAPALARSVGRARRSAVGMWTFEGGGFVVEGGHRGGSNGTMPPLIARVPFPSTWRCVVVIPEARPGVSGEAEAEAFASLPAPNVSEVDHVATLVLLRMLPALAENDIAAFGAALTEVQEINGRWFASAQGGTFAPGPSTMLIQRMREWGAAGVALSSWGPAGSAVVVGADIAKDVAANARAALGGAGRVHAGPFPAHGATVSVSSRA
jgi:beta-RFAP synthase